MLGVGPLGDVAYANPAYAEMLGYGDRGTLTGLSLCELLAGHEARTPMDCLKTLRTAAVVDWNHGQNYVIRTMVSAPLLLRETDTLLLIGVTDVTDWLWETNRFAGPRQSASHAKARGTVGRDHSRQIALG